jgi:hypothetical protein
MDANVKWYLEKKIERTIVSLKKHNMQGIYVENTVQLMNKIEELIPKNSLVAVGDSMTLFETGVIERLRSGKYQFLDKYEPGLTRIEKDQIYRQTFSADTFLCSTNALTEAGELYNIDGNGSRVAAMIYGPKQVIIVAGVNKIVKNMQEAEIRVRNYAAPMDAKRLNKKTPCTTVGYCVDCQSEERICNDFVVIRRQFNPNRIKVIIIGGSYGY